MKHLSGKFICSNECFYISLAISVRQWTSPVSIYLWYISHIYNGVLCHRSRIAYFRTIIGINWMLLYTVLSRFFLLSERFMQQYHHHGISPVRIPKSIHRLPIRQPVIWMWTLRRSALQYLTGIFWKLGRQPNNATRTYSISFFTPN